MLDDLDSIPWSALEHAYGDAGDLPNLLRALVSGDPDQREWAQEMLYMGPFHQGSLYSCTPFVVRVLLQMVQEQDAALAPWILQYVSRVLAAAFLFLPVSDPLPPESEEAFAAQILAEIRSQWPVVLGLLEHPDRHSLALLRLLVLLKGDLPHLERLLAEQFNVATDDSLRAALVFCCSLVADTTPLPWVQELLEQTSGSPVVRIAAGFGLIAAVGEPLSDKALTDFCGVMANHFVALERFDELYEEHLSPLGAPSGKERLLECLQQGWSAHQRGLILHALLRIYAHLPTARSHGIRVGYNYYLEALVRVAFPEGRLSPETTIRDLNDTQRRILEAFQQYDLPSITWNVYGPFDYRTALGFDFRSKTDFLDFMSGERSAQHTKQ